jgi:ubiquinone/menaquinone biosynthesis C-methylase UbiE
VEPGKSARDDRAGRIKSFSAEKRLVMKEVPRELAINLAAFRTAQAVADFSFYRLLKEEAHLFPKYYKSGDSVLDLACGLGRTTLLLHEMGLEVRGVDRSDLFIETAKRRLPYLDLRVGSYDSIAEPDSSFSHVLISLNGIDYAYPAAQRLVALKECARVLKPGGTLIYSSHNLKSLHWFSPYYRNKLLWRARNSIRAFKEWDYVLEDGVYAFYGAPGFVVRQTEAVGLRLIEMRGFCKLGAGRLDSYLSPYLHYVFTKPTKTSEPG